MSDPLRIHQMDQTLAAVGDMARITFAYYRSLVDAGFNDEQAMFLVGEMQSSMFALTKQQGDSDV